MKARDIMTADPATCAPWDPVARAVEIMAVHDCGSVPVIDPDHGRIVGILTDRDITLRLVRQRLDPDTTPVARVMSRGVVCCLIDHDIEDIEQIMRTHQVRRIPVVNSVGHVIGVIAQADLARRISAAAALVEAESLARTLERISEPTRPAESDVRVSDCPVVFYRSQGMRLAL